MIAPRRKPLEITAADLFCGAGGTSTGMVQAVELLEQQLGVKINLKLVAVNHWPVAIATHSANHKFAQHLCHGLDGVNPRELFPNGIDFLVASPECTHHSNARGGKPMSDQSRASGWHVVRWIEALQPKFVLIENVREFKTWGPLGKDGRPLKSQRGKTYEAFVAAIAAHGYVVEDRELNAADHGDPTTRVRLFLLCRRGQRKPVWPIATHAKHPDRLLVEGLKPWRPAREIIDWQDHGRSIFNRERPLSPNTMRRIVVGLRKFSGIDLEPFLVNFYGTGTAASVDAPAPSVTAQGGHVGVAQPFIVPQHSENTPRSIDRPAPTVTTTSRGVGLAQPFLLGQQSAGAPRSTEEPAPTVATDGAIAKVEPLMVAHFGERGSQEPRTHSIDEPAPTVTSRGAAELVQPFIVEAAHGTKTAAESQERRAHDPQEPIGAVTGSNRFGVAEPFMCSAGGPETAPRSVEEPAHTVLTRDHIGVATPFIAGAGGPTGSGKPQSVDSPLKTVLGENHKGIAEPMIVPDGPDRARSLADPLPTITAARRGELGLAQPAFILPKRGRYGNNTARSIDDPVQTVVPHHGAGYIVQAQLIQYNGTADAQSINKPLGTVTGKPRYALLVVYQDGRRYLLDILFRMLKPRELARAQGFPDSYQFTGKTEDVVKQIGNAVPVGLAKSLCLAGLAQVLNLVRGDDGLWIFPTKRRSA